MMDSDDVLSGPDALKICYDYAQQNKADFIFFDREQITEDKVDFSVSVHSTMFAEENKNYDGESLLNLIRPLPRPKYYYADATTDGDTTAMRPKMIVIGDSFWWTIAVQLPLGEIFSQVPYWYYNSTVYYDERYNSVDELDLTEELLSSNFIVSFRSP